MKNSNQPIYPLSGSLIDKCGIGGLNPFGLTKREHFASLAMQGMLADPSQFDVPINFIMDYIGVPRSVIYSPEVHYPKYLAKRSVQYADALLAELDGTQTK